eukprot:12526476-Alexandrium_andersonii.AAC.1
MEARSGWFRKGPESHDGEEAHVSCVTPENIEPMCNLRGKLIVQGRHNAIVPPSRVRCQSQQSNDFLPQ